MHHFFLKAIAYDHACNNVWIETLEDQNLEHISNIRKHMCHILNVHHLWISRLVGQPVISDDWDDLPFYAWKELNDENFRLLQSFLQNTALETVIVYQSSDGNTNEKTSSDIIYHLLNHATHHRAIINHLIRNEHAIPAEMNYIAYE